ncbi:hypothetical protein Avbf_16985 [Armadillidium vulgare]|nr:hypothetical protein Avbf_16985 [Armadillidium vulgare]
MPRHSFTILPPERQILEKGTFYLSKGLHPEEFFDIEYEEVSSKLDKLALEVQSYLSIKNPNHPAVSIELISPEVPLQNSIWSHDQTSELFQSIRHVLCMKKD